MGKAIVVGLTIVIIAVLIAVVAVYFRRRQGKETALAKGWAIKGELNAAQERMIVAENDVAADIMNILVAPPTSIYQLDREDMTILSSSHREMIELWLKAHKDSNEIRRRVIGQ